MIINAKYKVSLATPMYMSYISLQKKIKTYRIMRSFIELNIIYRNPNDSYVVYSLYSTPEEWRIFIKGPKNTPYYNKWLNLYMVMPSNYPTEPPKFRFLTIPFHPNVSSEGTVIFNLNDRDYTSSLGIDSIISGIINLLRKPDKNCPINQRAMELYMTNKKEYRKKQKEEGEIGCNDYHQYLQDEKIYNEIPKDVVVPKEDRGESNVISITKEVVNEAALKGTEIIDKCLLDINDYELVHKLGSGGCADVYLVIEKTTNYEFAAKIPKKEKGEDEQINYIKEVNVISIFNHGAISKLYGYCLKDFNDNDRCVIIMEYLSNGDLSNVIEDEMNHKTRDGWDFTQKLINLYGIASGMAYSVSFGITHSDLKPQNVLMTNKLYPKISDFDSARIESEGNSQSFVINENEISTPLYTAPEIIAAEDFIAEKSDIYSYSIIIFEVITALKPYQNITSIPKFYMDVVKGLRPKIPNSVPSQYKKLMMQCWDKDPDNRPTFKEIIELFKTDTFLNDKNIDRKRFEEYVNYIDNYKESITDSKFIRPLSHADKNKMKQKHSEKDDEVLKSKNIPIINLKNYTKKEFVGSGKYSQVYRIINIKTNKNFAAKISFQINGNVFSEVNIMQKLNHPSILKFIGYSPVNFENDKDPTIITEYAENGFLQDIIDKAPNKIIMNSTRRLIIIYGIVAGMAYLHEHSILHNDLKPSNVLLDEKFYPKISDFGLAQKTNNFEDDEDAFVSNSEDGLNIKGTPSFIAPETWSDQVYNKETDMYAFGVLLYEIVCMKKAFQGLKHFQIAYKVAHRERPIFSASKKDDVFKPLIERCWDQDPFRRPTFNDLLDELKDDDYMTSDVDQKEFKKYVQLVQNLK